MQLIYKMSSAARAVNQNSRFLGQSKVPLPVLLRSRVRWVGVGGLGRALDGGAASLWGRGCVWVHEGS